MRGARRGHVSTRGHVPARARCTVDRRRFSPAGRVQFLLRPTLGVRGQQTAGRARRRDVPAARQLRPALPVRAERSDASRPDVGEARPRRARPVPSRLRPISAPGDADLRVRRRPRPVLLPPGDRPPLRARRHRRRGQQRPGEVDGDPGGGRGTAVAGSSLSAERPPRSTSASGTGGVDVTQLRQTAMCRLFRGLPAALRRPEGKDLSPELSV